MNQFPKKRIQAVIDYVWESKHSAMYRELWISRNIAERPSVQNIEDFKLIPFLIKGDLLKYPNPSDRLFVPLSDIKMLRSTSGTSSKEPLLLWRDFFASDYYKLLAKNGAKRVMIFFAYNYFMSNEYATRQNGMETICGDPYNLVRSSRILADCGVDTVTITPSLALILHKFLDEIGYLSDIKHMLLWGEYVSDPTYKMLRQLYPNALFYFYYSLAEVNDTIGYATPFCEYENKNKHIKTEDCFIEIIDGELVVTTLRIPNALPLIRYKTGDIVSAVSGTCPCGDTNPRIKVEGRSQGDVVRIGGGEIQVEELDRVMSEFSSYIDPVFFVQVRESIVDEKRIVGMHFSIIKKENVHVDEEQLRDRISATIIEHFRLSSTMRLKDAISAGIFSNPYIEFVNELEINAKNPRLRLMDEN